MKHYLWAFAIAFLGFSTTHLSAQQYVLDKMDLSIFPKAQKGYQQFVIEVPHSSMEEDANKKIEIYVGKYAQVDQCNRHFLIGEMAEKNLQGYGYKYYEFSSKGDVAGTLMGCGNTEKVNKLVTAQPMLKDYNGRMPIVIYVPEGYEVLYKIYKAEPEVYRAAQRKQK